MARARIRGDMSSAIAGVPSSKNTAFTIGRSELQDDHRLAVARGRDAQPREHHELAGLLTPGSPIGSQLPITLGDAHHRTGYTPAGQRSRAGRSNILPLWLKLQ